MKIFLKSILICLFLFNTSLQAVNYLTEEEYREAAKEGAAGLCTISIDLEQNKNRKGSGMAYLYKDKIIGITAAHIFNDIPPEKRAAKISFNWAYNNKILEIPTQMIQLSPSYKPARNVFEERDPALVREDIAIFSIPYFPLNLKEKLFELNITPVEPSLSKHEVEAYAYGPAISNDFNVFKLNSSPQKIKGEITFDNENKIFKINHVTNFAFLTINEENHKIDLHLLKNKISEIRDIPGDSGSNVLASDSRITLATMTHSDYLFFFQQNSPLASFYKESVLSKAPSIERSTKFVEDLSVHGKILKEKSENNKKFYIFQANESIPFSSLLTPLYLHYNLIEDFIGKISSPNFLQDQEILQILNQGCITQ